MPPSSLLPHCPTPTPSHGLLALSFDFSFKPAEEAGEVKTTSLFAQCPKQWWTGDRNGGDFWNVQRRLMSWWTNRTKIIQIWCDRPTLLVKQVCSFYTEIPIQELCFNDLYAQLAFLWLIQDNNNTGRCAGVISKQTEDVSDQTGWA